jgi:hypothetical protein
MPDGGWQMTGSASSSDICHLARGGVAQLGERLLCKQEVIGSIPFTSTISGGGPRDTRASCPGPVFVIVKRFLV